MWRNHNTIKKTSNIDNHTLSSTVPLDSIIHILECLENEIIKTLVLLTDMFTGADCTYLIKTACFNCLLEFQNNLKDLAATSIDDDDDDDDSNNNEDNINKTEIKEHHIEKAVLKTIRNNNSLSQVSHQNDTNNIKSADEYKSHLLIPNLNHFKIALNNIQCSVTSKDLDNYRYFQNRSNYL